MKNQKACAFVFEKEKSRTSALLVQDGIIVDSDFVGSLPEGIRVHNFKDCILLPGFVDVHVHLREPGFLYKEDILSGTLAAARGGYTTVCAMPNLAPAPDCLQGLQPQLDAIAQKARIRVLPYGTLTKERKGAEKADFAALAPYVCAFSDDGSGVQSEEMMLDIMRDIKAMNGIIAAHCEDESLLFGGVIHKGSFAEKYGYPGICSESEWKPIERDIKLVEKTGCRYHVCHISCKESVELIRKAKAQGLPVTCETAPHYLVFDENDMQEKGSFKMNPPLRGEADKMALLEGIIDGTIDMIATDHAPHSVEEKAKGLLHSPFGITGLETAFPVLYTELVKKNVISIERLIELMHGAPHRIFGIGSKLEKGAPADFTVFDLNEEYVIDPVEFLSKGKSTPFEGRKVFGRCKMTVCGGKIVWEDTKKEAADNA